MENCGSFKGFGFIYIYRIFSLSLSLSLSFLFSSPFFFLSNHLVPPLSPSSLSFVGAWFLGFRWSSSSSMLGFRWSSSSSMLGFYRPSSPTHAVFVLCWWFLILFVICDFLLVWVEEKDWGFGLVGFFFLPAVDWWWWWWWWWMFVLCWFFFFFFFAVDVFIIILMSYLYYFNQIAKNIDPLVLEVKR